MEIKTLIIAGLLGTALASQRAVVYQSHFDTATDLTDAGLTSAGVGGSWSLNTTFDRAEISAPSNPNRATLYTSDSFQSGLGFTLDVSWLQTQAGSRFTFGLVDAAYTVDGGSDWLNQAMPNAYGIGISSAGWFEGGTDPFTLGFNDGTSSAVNDFTALTTLAQESSATSSSVSITVTPGSWSYSLNGAAATTGLFTFDTSRSYRFIAYGQTANGGGNNLNGSYFSNITLTAIPTPEPSTLGLLGMGGAMLIAARRRKAGA